MGRRLGLKTVVRRTTWLPVTVVLLLTQACGAGESGEEISMATDGQRFLALGDSYTIGEGVDSTARWPVILARALRTSGIPVEDPVVVARTGWTTRELSEGIQQADPEGTYDLVTLLIGVNNQYRGLDLEEYRTQFSELLERAVGFAGGDPGRVLVLSIPDWGVTPFAQGRDRDRVGVEIDAFNEMNRRETESAGARYVDVTGISREAEGRPELLAGDGLHPSGAMYELWVQAALPAARRILGGGGP
jgi:lysophospholipase L1-like esterase